MRPLVLFAILALVGCRQPSPICAKDALAERYAADLSRNWGATLTTAFVSMEVGRLEQLGHPLTLEQQDRLAAGYGPLVERFYSSDVWLPGLREYVDKHLSHSEQCEVLAYYQTDVGRKVFEMQVTPGELEFVRQQATNVRRGNPQFAREREAMLRIALPEVGADVLTTGPSP